MHHFFQVTPIAHSIVMQIVYMLLNHNSNAFVLTPSQRFSRDTVPDFLARIKPELNTKSKMGFLCFKKFDSYWVAIAFQFISTSKKRNLVSYLLSFFFFLILHLFSTDFSQAETLITNIINSHLNKPEFHSKFALFSSLHSFRSNYSIYNQQ